MRSGWTWAWRVAAIGYIAVIALASLWPSGVPEVYDPLAGVSSGTHKLGHVACYVGLVPMVVLALFGQRGWRWLLWAPPACIAYGGLLELLQTMVPGRNGCWQDGLINAMGVAVGTAGLSGWRLLNNVECRMANE